MTKKPARHIHRSLAAVAAVGCLAAATLFAATPAQAAEPPSTEDRFTAAEQALARHDGITPEQAREKFATQAVQSEAASAISEALGDDLSAGAYIDASGQLIATATSDASVSAVADAARSVGADVEVRVVAKSEAELAAQNDAVSAAAVDVPGIASWAIDPEANNVVVQAVAGANDPATLEALAAIRATGATVVETEALPTQLAGMVGGEQYEFRVDGANYVCSVGFPARTSSGAAAMVSAGHCVEGASTFSFKGSNMGSPIGFSFPGDDYAAFTLAGSVSPRGAVTTWDGNEVKVAGSQEAAVGASICKSGRTTQWTCGTITGKNATVNYGGGDTVSGLTATSACTQQGDSGGANVAGSQAQAVTSGGALFDHDGNASTAPVCGERAGRSNQSFVQPVNEILQRYSLTLQVDSGSSTAPSGSSPSSSGGGLLGGLFG
jgi:streptogrisin C